MVGNFRGRLLAFTLVICLPASALFAQQKPQWMPGQVGLNAGILPSPGFTYVNMDANYNAGTYNDLNGKAIPVTGTYNVWAIENIFYYVPNFNVFGGHLGLMVMFPTPATGSLVADITSPQLPNLSATVGAAGVLRRIPARSLACRQ